MRQRTAQILQITLLSFLFMISAYAGSQGTTLTGTKEAQATIQAKEHYAWDVQKVAPPSPVPVPAGSTVPVQFTINVYRIPQGEYLTTALTTHVCVTNGERPTDGLYVTDQIEQNVGGTWTLLGSPLVLPVRRELRANDSVCWDETFSGIQLNPHLTYRNRAIASIDNWLGYEGMNYSIDILSPITMQVEVLESTDESATLDDLLTCPYGFTCTQPWTSQPLTDSTTLTFTVPVTNPSIVCGTFELKNYVKVTSNDTFTVDDATATALIYTGTCNCTGTIGYWKTHPELLPPLLPKYLGTPGGEDTLVVTTLTMAIDVLNQNVYGDSSNGITKLYAQLLAAKFAIQRGADPTLVQSTIAAADIFLATHSYLEWGSLTSAEQAQVVSWASYLQQYNSGIFGPGHC